MVTLIQSKSQMISFSLNMGVAELTKASLNSCCNQEELNV